MDYTSCLLCGSVYFWFTARQPWFHWEGMQSRMGQGHVACQRENNSFKVLQLSKLWINLGTLFLDAFRIFLRLLVKNSHDRAGQKIAPSLYEGANFQF
jgi:hypothetical protein